MKTPNLLDVPKDNPTRQERIKAFKKEHGIWTHRATNTDYPWTALAFAKSIEALSGYSLTDEQKKDPYALIAGYCRLLDESGLLACGKTEFKAIIKLCGNLNIPTLFLKP